MQGQFQWARAHGAVPVRARMRTTPEDSRVEEVLGFEAQGDGEHVLVRVEKRGANTQWAAKALARMAGGHPATRCEFCRPQGPAGGGRAAFQPVAGQAARAGLIHAGPP
ncbi:MAG: tRNA pseudouridine(13) synthase TruD [Gammaproteobacteria bacterium]